MTNLIAGDILKVSELAAYLQLSRSKAYSLIETGEIPCLKIGKAVRVRRVDLDSWIAKHLIGRETSPVAGLSVAGGSSRSSTSH